MFIYSFLYLFNYLIIYLSFLSLFARYLEIEVTGIICRYECLSFSIHLLVSHVSRVVCPILDAFACCSIAIPPLLFLIGAVMLKIRFFLFKNVFFFSPSLVFLFRFHSHFMVISSSFRFHLNTVSWIFLIITV